MRPAPTASSCRRAARARSGVAAKASAGAVAHVRIAEVVNIARALEQLKDLGVWTVGLAADAATPYDAVDFTLPDGDRSWGREGEGLRRLVRERCDFLASIPMSGHVGSVNVSVAAGVVLFEAVRQRRNRIGQRVRLKLGPILSEHGGGQLSWTAVAGDQTASKGRLDVPCPSGTGSAIICSLSGWRSSVR